jgi:hypothetical protein
MVSDRVETKDNTHNTRPIFDREAKGLLTCLKEKVLQTFLGVEAEG